MSCLLTKVASLFGVQSVIQNMQCHLRCCRVPDNSPESLTGLGAGSSAVAVLVASWRRLGFLCQPSTTHNL